jgi:hypothetical protein
MTLAATFFGGLNVAADTVGKQALDAQLTNTPVDVNLFPGLYGQAFANASTFRTLVSNVQTVDFVKNAESIGQASSFNGSLPQLWAIQGTSTLYQHITLVAGRMNLAPNETIINADSPLAQTLAIGKNVRYTLASFYVGFRQVSYNVTLRLVGQVSLDKLVQRTLGFGYYCSTPGFGNPGLSFCSSGPSGQSVLITSWEKTFAPALDWSYNQSRAATASYSYAQNARVNVYLDRDRLISPFDVEGSIGQIQAIEARISTVASQSGFRYQDNLLSELQGFSSEIFSLRIQYTVVSIPVFFLAWYVGRTVSQSSFNLRRKEIGLLMTRGFTRGQLFRQFLTEAIMVGVIAGSAGVVAAYLLNPVFIQVLGGSTGSVVLTSDSVIVTVLFTLILTFFAVFSPARQATNMDPAKALKEYVYLEETRPTKKRGAIIAFILGLYQLILLVTGQNYMTFQRYFYGANFLLAIVIIIASVLSLSLTYIGPFLFLFGAASLSTGAAQRFHRGFAAFSRRIIGDVAALASKSVFRNPRRVAALVFIVALIAGYSIWVIGDQASQLDYNYRQAQVQNGSDIRISGFSTIADATLVANQLRTGWSNITGATAEADFSQNFNVASGLQVKAIDPATWKQSAYYQHSWFTGDFDATLSQMAANNSTIVLDHGVASYYSYFIGGRLNTSKTFSLSIIGFFGPDYSHQYSGPFYSFSPEGWSFVPIKLLGENITFFSPTTTNIVLAKVDPSFSLPAVAESVQRAYPSLSVSAAQPSSQDTQGIINAGSQNVLRLGTAFAGLAAVIGVGTVAYTGYREREKEITMVAVRGLSYRQLAGLLITEFLPVVVYALILATVVGLIVVWGDAQGVNSLNGGYLSLLEPRRVTFPLWASINIFAIIGLLLAGVFIPAAFAARKDLSKMSRTVRFA